MKAQGKHIFGAILAMFLTLVASLPAQDYQHDKVLQEAIAKGDLAKVTELIEAEPARLNRKIQFHHFPVCVAIEKCQAKIVEYLLSKGAEVNAVDDKSGEHALFSLVKLAPFRDAKRLDAVKELLQMLVAHKVDVKLRNKDGETALYSLAAIPFRTAFLPLKFEFMKLLMDQGASLKGQDKTTLPVLLILFHLQRNSELAGLIHVVEDEKKAPTRQVVIDTLKFLLENGADPDGIDVNNNTAMIRIIKQKPEYFSTENKAEMIRILIDHGANTRRKNKAGESPKSLIARDDELLKEALKHRPSKNKTP